MIFIYSVGLLSLLWCKSVTQTDRQHSRSYAFTDAYCGTWLTLLWKVCTARRKGLRRIWDLPFNTHSRL